MMNIIPRLVTIVMTCVLTPWAWQGAPVSPKSSPQARVALPATEVGYSPDHSLVVFSRATSNKPAFSPDQDTDPRELWLAHSDGTNARRLLAARNRHDIKRNLRTFASPAFGADGHRIYFLCPAWMTSWALHVYNLDNGTEHFVRSAASFEAIWRGRFTGCLLVTDHTYREQTQSYYYPHVVVTPEGIEIAKVGDQGGDNDPVLSAWRQRFMPASPTASRGGETAADPGCR